MISIASKKGTADAEATEHHNIASGRAPASSAIELKESKCRELYAKALDAQMRGENELAASLYQQLLNSDLFTISAEHPDSYMPDVPTSGSRLSTQSLKLKYLTLKNLSELQASSGHLLDSIQSLLLATDLDDTDVQVLGRLGKLALEANDASLAKKVLLRALNIQPSHWSSVESYATSLFLLGDYENCMDFLQTQALQTEPNWMEGKWLLELCETLLTDPVLNQLSSQSSSSTIKRGSSAQHDIHTTRGANQAASSKFPRPTSTGAASSPRFGLGSSSGGTLPPHQLISTSFHRAVPPALMPSIASSFQDDFMDVDEELEEDAESEDSATTIQEAETRYKASMLQKREKVARGVHYVVQEADPTGDDPLAENTLVEKELLMNGPALCSVIIDLEAGNVTIDQLMSHVFKQTEQLSNILDPDLTLSSPVIFAIEGEEIDMDYLVAKIAPIASTVPHAHAPISLNDSLEDSQDAHPKNTALSKRKRDSNSQEASAPVPSRRTPLLGPTSTGRALSGVSRLNKHSQKEFSQNAEHSHSSRHSQHADSSEDEREADPEASRTVKNRRKPFKSNVDAEKEPIDLDADGADQEADQDELRKTVAEQMAVGELIPAPEPQAVTEQAVSATEEPDSQGNVQADQPSKRKRGHPKTNESAKPVPTTTTAKPKAAGAKSTTSTPPPISQDETDPNSESKAKVDELFGDDKSIPNDHLPTLVLTALSAIGVYGGLPSQNLGPKLLAHDSVSHILQAIREENVKKRADLPPPTAATDKPSAATKSSSKPLSANPQTPFDSPEAEELYVLGLVAVHLRSRPLPEVLSQLAHHVCQNFFDCEWRKNVLIRLRKSVALLHKLRPTEKGVAPPSLASPFLRTLHGSSKRPDSSNTTQSSSLKAATRQLLVRGFDTSENAASGLLALCDELSGEAFVPSSTPFHYLDLFVAESVLATDKKDSVPSFMYEIGSTTPPLGIFNARLMQYFQLDFSDPSLELEMDEEAYDAFGGLRIEKLTISELAFYTRAYWMKMCYHMGDVNSSPSRIPGSMAEEAEYAKLDVSAMKQCLDALDILLEHNQQLEDEIASTKARQTKPSSSKKKHPPKTEPVEYSLHLPHMPSSWDLISRTAWAEKVDLFDRIKERMRVLQEQAEARAQKQAADRELRAAALAGATPGAIPTKLDNKADGTPQATVATKRDSLLSILNDDSVAFTIALQKKNWVKVIKRLSEAFQTQGSITFHSLAHKLGLESELWRTKLLELMEQVSAHAVRMASTLSNYDAEIERDAALGPDRTNPFNCMPRPNAPQPAPTVPLPPTPPPRKASNLLHPQTAAFTVHSLVLLVQRLRLDMALNVENTMPWIKTAKTADDFTHDLAGYLPQFRLPDQYSIQLHGPATTVARLDENGNPIAPITSDLALPRPQTVLHLTEALTLGSTRRLAYLCSLYSLQQLRKQKQEAQKQGSIDSQMDVDSGNASQPVQQEATASTSTTSEDAALEFDPELIPIMEQFQSVVKSILHDLAPLIATPVSSAYKKSLRSRYTHVFVLYFWALRLYPGLHEQLDCAYLIRYLSAVHMLFAQDEICHAGDGVILSLSMRFVAELEDIVEELHKQSRRNPILEALKEDDPLAATNSPSTSFWLRYATELGAYGEHSLVHLAPESSNFDEYTPAWRKKTVPPPYNFSNLMRALPIEEVHGLSPKATRHESTKAQTIRQGLLPQTCFSSTQYTPFCDYQLARWRHELMHRCICCYYNIDIPVPSQLGTVDLAIGKAHKQHNRGRSPLGAFGQFTLTNETDTMASCSYQAQATLPVVNAAQIAFLSSTASVSQLERLWHELVLTATIEANTPSKQASESQSESDSQQQQDKPQKSYWEGEEGEEYGRGARKRHAKLREDKALQQELAAREKEKMRQRESAVEADVTVDEDTRSFLFVNRRLHMTAGSLSTLVEAEQRIEDMHHLYRYLEFYIFERNKGKLNARLGDIVQRVHWAFKEAPLPMHPQFISKLKAWFSSPTIKDMDSTLPLSNNATLPSSMIFSAMSSTPLPHLRYANVFDNIYLLRAQYKLQEGGLAERPFAINLLYHQLAVRPGHLLALHELGTQSTTHLQQCLIRDELISPESPVLASQVAYFVAARSTHLATTVYQLAVTSRAGTLEEDFDNHVALAKRANPNVKATIAPPATATNWASKISFAVNPEGRIVASSDVDSEDASQVSSSTDSLQVSSSKKRGRADSSTTKKQAVLDAKKTAVLRSLAEVVPHLWSTLLPSHLRYFAAEPSFLNTLYKSRTILLWKGARHFGADKKIILEEALKELRAWVVADPYVRSLSASSPHWLFHYLNGRIKEDLLTVSMTLVDDGHASDSGDDTSLLRLVETKMNKKPWNLIKDDATTVPVPEKIRRGETLLSTIPLPLMPVPEEPDLIQDWMQTRLEAYDEILGDYENALTVLGSKGSPPEPKFRLHKTRLALLSELYMPSIWNNIEDNIISTVWDFFTRTTKPELSFFDQPSAPPAAEPPVANPANPTSTTESMLPTVDAPATTTFFESLPGEVVRKVSRNVQTREMLLDMVMDGLKECIDNKKSPRYHKAIFLVSKIQSLQYRPIFYAWRMAKTSDYARTYEANKIPDLEYRLINQKTALEWMAMLVNYMHPKQYLWQFFFDDVSDLGRPDKAASYFQKYTRHALFLSEQLLRGAMEEMLEGQDSSVSFLWYLTVVENIVERLTLEKYAVGQLLAVAFSIAMPLIEGVVSYFYSMIPLTDVNAPWWTEAHSQRLYRCAAQLFAMSDRLARPTVLPSLQSSAKSELNPHLQAASCFSRSLVMVGKTFCITSNTFETVNVEDAQLPSHMEPMLRHAALKLKLPLPNPNPFTCAQQPVFPAIPAAAAPPSGQPQAAAPQNAPPPTASPRAVATFASPELLAQRYQASQLPSHPEHELHAQVAFASDPAMIGVVPSFMVSPQRVRPAVPVANMAPFYNPFVNLLQPMAPQYPAFVTAQMPGQEPYQGSQPQEHAGSAEDPIEL